MRTTFSPDLPKALLMIYVNGHNAESNTSKSSGSKCLYKNQARSNSTILHNLIKSREVCQRIYCCLYVGRLNKSFICSDASGTVWLALVMTPPDHRGADLPKFEGKGRQKTISVGAGKKKGNKKKQNR